MKKIIVSGLVLVVLIIGSWSGFHYISHDGEFSKWGHASLGEEHFKDGQPFYLDYHFRWEGLGSPTIEKIEFFQKDGTLVEKEDALRVQPYVASSMRGMFDEESATKEGRTDDLSEVNGIQVKEDLYLTLRVEGASADKDLGALRITYKKYGVTQSQYIPFDEGVVSDAEAF